MPYWQTGSAGWRAAHNVRIFCIRICLLSPLCKVCNLKHALRRSFAFANEGIIYQISLELYNSGLNCCCSLLVRISDLNIGRLDLNCTFSCGRSCQTRKSNFISNGPILPKKRIVFDRSVILLSLPVVHYCLGFENCPGCRFVNEIGQYIKD